jgi:hypothetical protein
MYGSETLSFTVREEHVLSGYENRVQTRIFGANRVEVTDSGENYIVRS